MKTRTARIARISAAAGYVATVAGGVGLISIGMNQAAGEPWGTVNDVALLVMVAAFAPLMLSFYELGGRTPLRPAQLAQAFGWVAVGVFVAVQVLQLAGVVEIGTDAPASGALVAGSWALVYIGLWIAGANLLAGPWLSAVRWVGVVAGLSAFVFAYGVLRGGVDSGWTWLGGLGWLLVGSVWALLMARLLGDVAAREG